MPRIAIVAALEREVKPLVRRWRIDDRELAGRKFRFYESGDFVLVCGGIGAEAARRAAEAVIRLYTPAVVYSVGFAGALRGLQVGDIVVPRRVVNAGDGSSTDTGQGDRVLVSFASVANPDQKSMLASAYDADAVDMEAAAVAKAAEAHAVTFRAIKAISDTSDFAIPSMERFIAADGRFRSASFAWFVALRPWLWEATLRLALHSARASRALCTCIANMSQDPVPANTPVRSSNFR